MINEDFVLQRIEPFLNINRELSEFEFMELFATGNHPLTLREQYEVINIMIAHEIHLVDEKEEETEVLNHTGIRQSGFFHQDVSNLLSIKNEHLCIMAQKGDRTALAALIEKNQRFIFQKALKISAKFKKTCMTEEDLFQEGVLGMIDAAERFDPSLDFSFLTYAWSWVRQRMERATLDTGFIIRLPVHMYEKVTRIQDGYLYSKDEIIRCIRYNEQYLNTVSLNTLTGENDDTELIELLPDEDNPSIEEIVEERLLHEDMEATLSMLKQREADVIRLRYGLLGKSPLTLEEIGKEYNVTRERIRQIEQKALRKLRSPTKSIKIKEYIGG